MTLILTIANENGLHQSSDYNVTDFVTGKLIDDSAGTKQLERLFRGMILRLAFTGLTDNGRRKTIDWLQEVFSSFSELADLKTICDELMQRCAAEIGSKGVLTLVLSVGEVGEPFRLVRISNRDLAKAYKARKEFRRQVRTVKKPFYLIDPTSDKYVRHLLTSAQIHRLQALSRALDKTPKEVQDELAKISAEVAGASKGRVSEGCWTGSLFREGDQRMNVQMRNIGENRGALRHAQSKVQNEAYEKVIKEALGGRPRNLVQSAAAVVVAPPQPKGKQEGGIA